MTSPAQWQNVEQIFQESLNCRKCFDMRMAEPALIDIAQPRFIGKDYFKTDHRIMVVCKQPGVGNKPEHRELNKRFRKILYEYKNGKVGLEELFAFQAKAMKTWGNRPGQFTEFYITGMGLKLNHIAFANIAWCASKSDKTWKGMLNQCFGLHTGRLIKEIGPDLVILSGFKTHSYGRDIKNILPKCKIIKTLSYAHRKGEAKGNNELKKVKDEILKFYQELQIG